MEKPQGTGRSGVVGPVAHMERFSLELHTSEEKGDWLTALPWVPSSGKRLADRVPVPFLQAPLERKPL